MATEWQKSWNTMGAERTIALYAPDAVFLRPDAERVSGKAAILSLFKTVLATNKPHIQMHSVASDRSGELAYDSGTYEETIETAGRTIHAHGDYLIIVKRQGDRWLIVEQAWTDAGREHP